MIYTTVITTYATMYLRQIIGTWEEILANAKKWPNDVTMAGVRAEAERYIAEYTHTLRQIETGEIKDDMAWRDEA